MSLGEPARHRRHRASADSSAGEEQGCAHRARVLHEDVETAERVGGGRNEGAIGGVIGDVHSLGKYRTAVAPHRGGRLLQCFRGTRADRDGGDLDRQRIGDGEANAVAGGGNDRAASLQSKVQRRPLRCSVTHSIPEGVAAGDSRAERGRSVAVRASKPVMLPEEAPKLLDRQTRIANQTRHGVWIDRIVPRDRENAHPVGHDDVLSLTNDTESSFLKGANRVEMTDARTLRHG